MAISPRPWRSGNRSPWRPAPTSGDTGVDLDDRVAHRLGVEGKLAVAAPLDLQLGDDADGGRPSIWYSLSASVTAGATTIESPVWMPTGSKFSIEQTVMTLSFASRITSNLDLLPAGDALFDEDLVNGGEADAVGRDVPELGFVVRDAAAGAAQRKGWADDDGVVDFLRKVDRVLDGGDDLTGETGWPIASIVSLNSCRSSALSIVSGSRRGA